MIILKKRKSFETRYFVDATICGFHHCFLFDKNEIHVERKSENPKSYTVKPSRVPLIHAWLMAHPTSGGMV